LVAYEIDAKVQIVREIICPLEGSEVKSRTLLLVKKKMKFADEAKVDGFNQAVEELL